MKYHNFLFASLLFLLSANTLADSITLQCPRVEELTLSNNQWHGIIPTTKTAAGFTISKINLSGPYHGTLTTAFGVGKGGIGKTASIICNYSDATFHNTSTLTGNLGASNFSTYFKMTDCRINKNQGLNCSN